MSKFSQLDRLADEEPEYEDRWKHDFRAVRRSRRNRIAENRERKKAIRKALEELYFDE